MLARTQAIPENLGPLLQQVAVEAVTRGRAYLRGEVIGPRGPLFKDSTVTALYVAIPVYFPDEFSGVDDPDLGTVIFAWLVPITDQEAEFVNRLGWKEFEAKLVKVDPDLLDFRRLSAG
jgi:hypothetical protein